MKNEGMDEIAVAHGKKPKKPEHEEKVAIAVRAADETLSDLAAFELDGQEDLDIVAGVLTETKAKAKELAGLKASVTKPINEALKAVRALFAPAEERLESIERTIKTKIAAFHAVSAEHNRAAAELAAEAVEAGEDPVFAIAAMGSVAQAPGVSIRLSWDFEITDEDAVPRSLCTPDPVKIRAYLKESEGRLPEKAPGVEAGEINGIRVFVKSTVVAR